MDNHTALEQMNKDLNTLMSTSVGRRSFLTVMPILLASCSHSSNHNRNREGDNSGQDTALTVEQERKMTQEYLPQMAKEYPRHKSAYAQDFVRGMGDKIVQANSLGGNPYNYTFTVVESKGVNAFALPAGTVYVTAPLIKMAKSEAELAGVIGHEIGHIQARHTAERMAEEKKGKTKGILMGIGGALLGGAAGIGLAKLICSKQDKECLKRIALYGAGAGVAGGLLIQKFGFMANSREDEMEADRIGFNTAYKAGYHKDHVGQFYNRLLEMEKQYKGGKQKALSAFTDAMSTHPPGENRVKQMNEMANTAVLKGPVISTPGFKKLQKIV